MIGSRNNQPPKQIGGRLKGKLKQIGTRSVISAINAIVKAPDVSEKGIPNEHNNIDVQNEPKFEHTRPEKKSSNSLEK